MVFLKACRLITRAPYLLIVQYAADASKGSSFTAMGSPLGALAPRHFVNHTAAGTISNILRPAVRPLKQESACNPSCKGIR